MKVHVYHPIVNTENLNETSEVIDIKKGYWLQKDSLRHSMSFVRVHSFKPTYVYYLYHFGSKPEPNGQGSHIVLSFCQNQRFLWMQRQHWLQKNDNIKWVVGMVGSAAIGYIVRLITE
jgi:hypothetical protein